MWREYLTGCKRARPLASIKNSVIPTKDVTPNRDVHTVLKTFKEGRSARSNQLHKAFVPCATDGNQKGYKLINHRSLIFREACFNLLSPMPDDKAAYLGMIQLIITRMGANSFILKGWNVTLVSALFALSVKDSNTRFVMIAFLPALVFWILDAYYLRQERLFRKLYDEASASTAQNQIVPLFSMATGKYQSNVEGMFSTMFSPTVLFLHGTVFATVILVILLLRLVQ